MCAVAMHEYETRLARILAPGQVVDGCTSDHHFPAVKRHLYNPGKPARHFIGHGAFSLPLLRLLRNQDRLANDLTLPDEIERLCGFLQRQLVRDIRLDLTGRQPVEQLL